MSDKKIPGEPINQEHMCLVTTSNVTYEGIVTVEKDYIQLQFIAGFMGMQTFRFKPESAKDVCRKILKMTE